MCGIIGIYNSDNVTRDLYHGLLFLQHRGQDACGMLTVDGTSVYMNKYKGLVSQVFNETSLSEFRGRTGIAHVRYPTQGSISLRDTQPFYVNYPVGIGLVHNGNILNYDELKNQLATTRRTLISKSDSEAVLNVLAEEILKSSKNQSFEVLCDAVGGLLSRVRGGYAIIAASVDERMVVFRDPNGIRPLVMGKKETEKGTSYAFASENACFGLLGYDFVRNVLPGEIVYIDAKGNLNSRTLTQENRAHCMFEWVYFARADAVLDDVSVYDARMSLGRYLATEFYSKHITVDVVMPVPDSSRPTAMALAEEIKRPYREGLLKNRYSQRTFIMPDQKLREDAVKFKLAPIESEIRGKRILLVDDSIVRGTTSRGIVSMLRKAGATEVHLAVSCPPIDFPCFYGVDMKTKEELIAANKTMEEIRAHLGVDSITYQTIDGLRKSIPCGICTACLDGEYPTEKKSVKVKLLIEP